MRTLAAVQKEASANTNSEEGEGEGEGEDDELAAGALVQVADTARRTNLAETVIGTRQTWRGTSRRVACLQIYGWAGLGSAPAATTTGGKERATRVRGAAAKIRNSITR